MEVLGECLLALKVLEGYLLALKTLKVLKVALNVPDALREVAEVAGVTATGCPTP